MKRIFVILLSFLLTGPIWLHKFGTSQIRPHEHRNKKRL